MTPIQKDWMERQLKFQEIKELLSDYDESKVVKFIDKVTNYEKIFPLFLSNTERQEHNKKLSEALQNFNGSIDSINELFGKGSLGLAHQKSLRNPAENMDLWFEEAIAAEKAIEQAIPSLHRLIEITDKALEQSTGTNKPGYVDEEAITCEWVQSIANDYEEYIDKPSGTLFNKVVRRFNGLERIKIITIVKYVNARSNSKYSK